MSNQRRTSSNEDPRKLDLPVLRMFHPSSGRENFGTTVNQPTAPTYAPIDPRFAMMIQMQAQQAIAASGMPVGTPYQGAQPMSSSPWIYGSAQQQYPNYFPMNR